MHDSQNGHLMLKTHLNAIVFNAQLLLSNPCQTFQKEMQRDGKLYYVSESELYGYFLMLIADNLYNCFE